MLITIPDVLTAQQVADFQQHLQQANWEDGRNTAGYVASQVKTNLQLPVDDPVAKQLGEFIVGVLANHPAFIAAVLPAKILPPRFNRYQGGGAYGNHIDNALLLCRVPPSVCALTCRAPCF